MEEAAASAAATAGPGIRALTALGAAWAEGPGAVWLHSTLLSFWSAFTLAVFFQGHLPQLTARVLDHEDLHSDLVLPNGHTLQAIVRTAATTALHSHTAGHELFDHITHEFHAQRYHHLPGLACGTCINIYP